MGLLNKIFGSNVSSDKTEDKKSLPSFDSLVEKARTSGKIEDLNILYKHFLELKEWVYITPSRMEVANAKPFIGIVDEKPWVFIFTDGEKANAYCRQFDGFVREDGSVFLIRMKVKNSLEILQQLSNRGVFGIRVNEGPNGWFCGLQDLPNIVNHLKIKFD